MTDLCPVTLPGGFERQGAWERTVWLRPLSGNDEAFLSEDAGSATLAARVTTLLGRCLSLDEGTSPITSDFTRALTVGDREAALLHLRRITLGDRLSCVLSCPACGQKLDLDLKTGDLLLPPYARSGRWHETTVEDEGQVFHVRFRLPNGGDQEWAASAARSDSATAAMLVLDRCVAAVTGRDTWPVSELPATVRDRLPHVMAELDPQAELILDARCPVCEAAFTAPLDTAEFLRSELALGGDALLREIHALALHYHWSEGEILSLTRQRRRRYLALLAESVMEAGTR